MRITLLKTMARCVCLGAVLVLPLPAFGHGTPYPKPTPDEAKQIAPPIPGAETFFEALTRHGRYLLSEDQEESLDAASKGYAFAKEIREGSVPDAQAVDAEYNRWLADQAVVKLAESAPSLILLDFTKGTPEYNPGVPVELPPQGGTLLLKVVTAAGPISFNVQDVNLSTSGDPGPFVVHLGTPGTTYEMLNLSEIPSGTSTLTMAFAHEGAAEPAFWYAVSVSRVPMGHLTFAAVDETGAPTPVFVRLTARETGRYWEPPNAIDLGPIMTSITGLPIYGPGKGYTHYKPGAFRGVYWIVPGPFETAIPPGEWDVYLHHGAEYVPIHDVLTIEPSQKVEKTYRLERFTNMPEKGWWSGDDHVHARLMSSDDARRVMAFVRAADVHVANILEMGNVERTWYAQQGFGPDWRVREGDYVLVPGQEDPRSAFGHAIGLNLKSMARDLDKYMLNDWVADTIHAQGGLYGHTHVGEGGLGIRRDMTLLIPRGKSDFNSIMQNILGTERYYDFLDLGFNLTASAGTDTPYGGAVGVVRVYAFLGENVPFSPDAWFDALKAGHTFVTNGPMVELTVEDAIPGDEIVVADDRPLRVHAKAWGIPGGSAPARLQLIRLSETAKEATSTDDQVDELTIDTTIDSGYGFWIAARATGHDGSDAHTTPVYVTREGFRHWNVARADQLLADRMNTLQDIENVVGEAEQKLKQGEIRVTDYWNRYLGEQAPQVRERTALVRKIYEELATTLAREKTARADDAR